MEYRNISREISQVAKDYQYQEPPSFLLQLQDWLSELSRLIRDFLNSLNFPGFGGADNTKIADFLQVLVVVAAVLMIIMVAILSLRRLEHLELQRKLALGKLETAEEILDAAGFKKQAAKLAEARLWREACRAIYMSTLFLLDEKKILAFASTKTNYEYIYSLKADARGKKILKPFREMVDEFEQLWFGYYQASENNYGNCLKLIDLIEAQTSEPL